MRIACLDHPYHQTTGSTTFLHDLLRRLGTLDLYFPLTGSGELPPESPPFDAAAYDVIVVLQVHEAFRLVPEEHPNVVFVPMYDSHVLDGCFYWSPAFNRAKVLCFSSTLYDEVVRRGAKAAWFPYYPDPEAHRPVERYDAPRGFFWMRRASFGPGLIARVAAGVEFEEFHVHVAPDPGEKPPAAEDLGIRTRNLLTTRWFASREEYAEYVRRANIYFAPRRVEGIGQGFLEAMAMGLCVVAPDTPTHNEYISPGVNGILFSSSRPEPADFSRFADLGRRARDSVARGRRRWEDSLDDLFDFLLTPTSRAENKRFGARRWLGRPLRPQREDAATGKWPAAAVVVRCPEPVRGLHETLAGALAQDYPELECLALAGKAVLAPAEAVEDERRLVWLRTPASADPAAALELALRQSAAEWFLFLQPGEVLIAPDSLRRMFQGAPSSADLICGHHLRRSALGLDESFRTAAPAVLARQLREGAADLRWLAALPAPCAVAWRRRLLERHGLDPSIGNCAWEDLLFRALAAGAEVHHADEWVSAIDETRDERREPAAWKDWVELAVRHGGATAGEALRNAFSAGSACRRRRPALLGLLRLRRGVPEPSPAPLDLKAEIAAAAGERYAATLEEGADFSRPGLPAFLRSVRGLSLREDWGRWSDGGRVEFDFRCLLPKRFTLTVRGYAVGENRNRPVRVSAGGCTRELRMQGGPAQDYRVRMRLRERAHRLVFEIPAPATRAELWGDTANDPRRLGVAFESLRIRPG